MAATGVCKAMIATSPRNTHHPPPTPAVVRSTSALLRVGPRSTRKLKVDQSRVRRPGGLSDMGILEVAPNHEAPRNAAVRYRVQDPAMRFYEALVMPNTSLLERVDLITAFDAVIAPRLDTFLNHAFERLVEPTYERLRAERDLPMVRTWSRWEGRDRTGRGTEIDIVAPLASGEVMTGSVKWNREPLTPQVFVGHVAALRRAADAGRCWAHAALRGPVLFLGAGGFDPRFHAVADTHAGTVLSWSRDEVYAEVRLVTTNPGAPSDGLASVAMDSFLPGLRDRLR